MPTKLTPYDITTTPWTLWRVQGGIRSIAGEFATKDEAERAIAQLQKLFPASIYVTQFTGKPISHCDRRSKFNDT